MQGKTESSKFMSVITSMIGGNLTNEGRRNLMRLFAYAFAFYIIIINVITSSEQTYQEPKDYYFYRGVIAFLAFLLVLRRKEIVSIPSLISVIAGTVSMIALFIIKKIRPLYYGSLYFRVILFSWIIFILFVILIVNSIIKIVKDGHSGHYKETIVLCSIFSIPVFFNARYLLPVLMPVLALLLSDLSRKQIQQLFRGLALGYYLAFLHMVAKSFIINADRYEAGRFLGAFGQVESGGMFCAGAIVCVLYFFILFRCKGECRRLRYVMLLILAIPPVYMTFIISSRSTELALLCLFAILFTFICGKSGKKAIFLRGVFTIGILVIVTIMIFVLSYYWNKKASRGEFDNPNYFQSHVMVLTNTEYKEGHFGKSSVLNVLDRASSSRVLIWAESFKQISWQGHPFEPLYADGGVVEIKGFVSTPHNFPILWLINYGIVGGVAVIIWYIRLIVVVLKRCIAKDEVAIFPMLWASYSIGVFLFSCVNWTYPVAFILLIMYGAVFVSGGQGIMNE